MKPIGFPIGFFMFEITIIDFSNTHSSSNSCEYHHYLDSIWKDFGSRKRELA